MCRIRRGVHEKRSLGPLSHLRSLASESSRELEVLGLDSDSLGVDGGQGWLRQVSDLAQTEKMSGMIDEGHGIA